jgi:hypothetical protein
VTDRDQDELTRERTPPPIKARETARMPGRSWVRGTEGRGPSPRIGRAILVFLSTGGVAVSLSLWLAGHGHLALRVLAGDVILATGFLLIM